MTPRILKKKKELTSILVSWSGLLTKENTTFCHRRKTGQKVIIMRRYSASSGHRNLTWKKKDKLPDNRQEGLVLTQQA